MSFGDVDYQGLFHAIPSLCLILTPDLIICAVTDSYLRATMTRRDEIVGKLIFDVFPDNPGDPSATGVQNLRASLQRVVETRESDTMAVQKYDIRRPDSEGSGFEERYWSPVNHPVLGEDGGLRLIVHRVEDVTEFVHLKAQRAEQSAMSENLKVRVERTETEVYLRAQEVQEANRRLHSVNEALAQRERELTLLQAELEERVKDRTRQLEFAEEERRKLFEQFVHSQKMEAVGRLAGGIAHDFNNLLTIINGCSEMLLDELAPGSTFRVELEQILSAGTRAATLTKQILIFSRKQGIELVPLNLNQSIQEAEELLRRTIGEDIEFVTSLAKDLGRVMSDPGLLHQVIMNLVVNARDAMTNGGRLTIGTSNTELDETYVASHPDVAPGSYIMLAVSDTGIGMSKELLLKVFDPFFTTKAPGKGTGLGLATVYGIVKESHGHVRVYSEPGQGSTFKIYLPRIRNEVEELGESPVTVPLQGGDETILLVEDEDDLRKLTRRILETAGYTVLEASNAGEALLLVEQARARFDLLVTDVVMPKMSGPALARRIASRGQGLTVLFISGFIEHPSLENGELLPGSILLPKPFTKAALLRKVREALAIQQTSAIP